MDLVFKLLRIKNCQMKKLFILVFVLVSNVAFAQQDGMLNQYMFNKSLVNPAYTGTNDDISSVLISRNQWINFEGAPRSNSFSIHAPISYFNMGIGGYVISDQIGPLHDVTLMGGYAYHVKFYESTLSFGMNVGFKYSSLNTDKVSGYDSGDQYTGLGVDENFMPDASLGVYYFTGNYYVGFSAKQLIGNRYSFVESKSDTEETWSMGSNLDRHYYLMGGFVYYLTDNILMRPSGLVKYVKNSDPQVDLNMSFLINDVVWVGASYRTGMQVALMTTMEISQNMSVGYSFDMPLTKFGTYTNGTHEIMLAYNFSLFRSRRVSPRYF